MAQPAPSRAQASRPLLRLLGLLARSWGVLGIALASLGLAAIARLLLTVVAGRWADGPLARGELPGVEASVALVATVALAVATFGSRAGVAVADRRIQRELRDRLTAAVLRARHRPALGAARGELGATLLADVPAVAGLSDLLLRRLVGDSLVVVGAVGLMVVISPLMAAGLVLAVPVAALAIGLSSRLVRRREAQARVATGALGGLFAELLAARTTLKLLGATEHAVRRLHARSTTLHTTSLRSDLAVAALLGAVWAVTGLLVLAVVAAGTWLVWRGATTAGGLVAFAFAAVQVIEPVRRAADLAAALQRALAAAQRVFVALDSATPEPTGGEIAPTRGVRLVVRGVRFGWEPGRPVLRDLELELGPGEQVALVGASGSGKSSLLALLVRLVEPDAGSIELDGRDLRHFDLNSLRRVVCLVEQDPGILSGTLGEALALGLDAMPATPTLVAAAEQCGLGPLLERIGLEGSVGEDGQTLSGGERQRLALARAVLRDPAVLLLDEATSAIDGRGEARIFEELRPWLAQRTVIVVSHRLSTARRWRRVVVLDRGGVVADGSFASVVSQPDAASLFCDQLEHTTVT